MSTFSLTNGSARMESTGPTDFTTRSGPASGSDDPATGSDDPVSRRRARSAERRKSRIVTIATLIAGCGATAAAVTFAQMLVVAR